MTGWSGEATSGVRLTGPYARKIRVGRYLIPQHVFFDVVGAAGEPDMHIHFEYRDGRPQVVELTVKAKDGGRGVRSSDLEPISLDGLAKSVMTQHTQIITKEDGGYRESVSPDWSHPAHERSFWELQGELAEAIGTRRGRVNEAMLQRVADLYEQYRGKNALQAISIDLGVSERTAARRVKAARDAGLIADGEVEN